MTREPLPPDPVPDPAPDPGVPSESDTAFQGGLSAAEQRFDTIRRSIGLFAGPVALVVVWLLPMPADVSVPAHRLAAIMALVVVWWVTEAIPIPVTGLIGTALAVFVGVAPAAEAFSQFANPTIFLFIGSFMLARAVETHGLDRRLAMALLSRRSIGSRLGRTRLAIGLMTLVLSAWMSNSATTAMMLPLTLGIAGARLGALGRQGGTATTGFLLVVAASSSIGGMLTPVGTPPNLITRDLLRQATDIDINFFEWMLLTAPIGLAMAVVLYVAAGRRFPLPASGGGSRPGASVGALGAPPEGPWTKGQRNCAVAFFTAVVLWVLPGALELIAPGHPLVTLLRSRLAEGAVAVLAATLLFVLPTDWKARRFTLEWKQAAGIDWGTILLFGGGLALGRLMFETGLAEHVGRGLVALSGVESLWGVTIVSVAIAISMTELTSNTAATNMLIPVVISICQVNDLDPVVPSLGAGLAASMAFMLPISTPPNAIVYGSGLIPIRSMMSFGIIMNIAGFVIVLVGLRLMVPLLGLS